MAKSKSDRKGSWSKKIIEKREKSGKWLTNMLAGRKKAKQSPSFMSIFRNKLELLQKDVAGALGLALPTYQQIERGERPVKSDRAEKIANKLGVKINKIFKPDPDKKKKYVAVIQNSTI